MSDDLVKKALASDDETTTEVVEKLKTTPLSEESACIEVNSIVSS